MTNTPSCQDPYDNSISADDARQIIRRLARAVPETETISLREGLGRVLAADPGYLWLWCRGPDDASDDRWRSIPQTIEFLPAEE